MNHQQDSARDELRARFTKWLETLVYRARVDYIRKISEKIEEIPIDDVAEEYLSYSNFEDDCIRRLSELDFQFEADDIIEAYMKLSSIRKKILVMLFIEEKHPGEIAKQIGCSVDYIYSQKKQALKLLRNMLERGEESE